MPLARFQCTLQNESGDAQPLAQLEVRREDTGALPQLYSDRDGLETKGNPAVADANGYVFFHVAGGAYKIQPLDANGAESGEPWRYVAVGLLQESDGSGGFTKSAITHDASGDVTIADDDANEIHKINNTSGGPINVFLPDVLSRTRSIRVVDIGYNAGTYKITVKPKAASGQTIMGGSEYPIDSNGASLGFDPDVASTSWI